MSDANTNTGLALTVAHCGTYKRDTEGQRNVHAALVDIARTISGVSVADADALREEFLDRFGRAQAMARVSAKSSGSAFSAKSELDFIKAGEVPPVLCQLHEAAGHVFKLRKLGAFPADQPLAVDTAAIRRHHADRWSKAGK